MRHGVKGRKLKRTASHRKALLKNLSISLLKHKRIRTTVAKAKELRGFIEPIITKARKGDLHSKKLVMELLKDKPVVKELFNDIVATVADRPGGYTRIVRLGLRRGDAAELAVIELVDYNALANERDQAVKEARETRREEAAAAAQQQNVEDAKVLEESK